MSRFISTLVLSPTPDGVQYALQADLVYQSNLLGETAKTLAESCIVVPRGFVSDLASIPKALWSTLPPFGRYSAAAVIHDFLFWSQTTSMQIANDVLKEAMTLLGCDEAVVQAIHAAVSLFGAPAWQRNRDMRSAGYTRTSTGEIPPYSEVPL